MQFTKRIKTLDSLRGIAALSVVLFHYGVFPYGYLGVHLFFIISGFVIYMSVQNVDSSIDFFKKRFSRLYPAYWFSVVLTTICILFFTNRHIPIKMFLFNLTMIQQFFKIQHIDGAYWSLEIELLFYIIIALLLKTKRIKEFVEYGIWGVILSSLLPYIHSNMVTLMLIYVLKFSGLFYSGILFYKIWVNGFSFKDFSKIIIAYVCVVFSDSGNQAVDFYKPYEVILLTTSFLLFFLFSINKLKFIEIKLLLFLGKISYSLYLLHEVIGGIILHFLNQHIPFTLVNLWMTILIIILISWLTNKYVEIPGSKLFRTYLDNSTSIKSFLIGKADK